MRNRTLWISLALFVTVGAMVSVMSTIPPQLPSPSRRLLAVSPEIEKMRCKEYTLNQPDYWKKFMLKKMVPGFIMAGVSLLCLPVSLCWRLCTCCDSCCGPSSVAKLYTKQERRTAQGLMGAVFFITLICVVVGLSGNRDVDDGVEAFTDKIVGGAQTIQKYCADVKAAMEAVCKESLVWEYYLCPANWQDAFVGLTAAGDNMVAETEAIQEKVIRADKARSSVIAAAYVLLLVTCLFGVLGAAMRKGLFATIMSFFIPLALLGVWAMYDVHMPVAQVLADGCYELDAAGNDTNANPLTNLFQCPDMSGFSMISVNLHNALNGVNKAIQEVNNDAEKKRLEKEAADVEQALDDLDDISTCKPLYDLLDALRKPLCGTMFIALLRMYKSQLALGVMFWFAWPIAAMGSRRFPKDRERIEGYSQIQTEDQQGGQYTAMPVTNTYPGKPTGVSAWGVPPAQPPAYGSDLEQLPPGKM